MRLARYRTDDGPRAGIVVGGDLVDVSSVVPARDVIELLQAPREELETAAADATLPRRPVEDVELLAPVRPPKYFAIGLNYADHVAEADLEVPDVPTVFNKQPTCVIGSGGAIERPLASTALDFEGELAFMIGRRCRHVPRDRAHEVIAGYLIANDVSVRDWQLRTPTITMGKSWDTHGPLGPYLTTPDEIDDPHALDIRTWVNGELRQESNTRHLIFDCFAQIEHLSTVCTLEPGDVVATGTPSGVGALADPATWLTAGDTVRIEIDGLGVLENAVVDEPSAEPWIDRP